ncbi:hypothetical protein Tco_0105840 [Tanacetum coccineum]
MGVSRPLESPGSVIEISSPEPELKRTIPPRQGMGEVKCRQINPPLETASGRCRRRMRRYKFLSIPCPSFFALFVSSSILGFKTILGALPFSWEDLRSRHRRGTIFAIEHYVVADVLIEKGMEVKDRNPLLVLDIKENANDNLVRNYVKVPVLVNMRQTSQALSGFNRVRYIREIDDIADGAIVVSLDMVFKEFDAKNPELVDEEKAQQPPSLRIYGVLCSFVLPDHKPFRTIATSLFYVSSLEALCKILDDYYKEKCARLIALQPLLIDREQPTGHRVDGSCLPWEDP